MVFAGYAFPSTLHSLHDCGHMLTVRSAGQLQEPSHLQRQLNRKQLSSNVNAELLLYSTLFTIQARQPRLSTADPDVYPLRDLSSVIVCDSPSVEVLDTFSVPVLVRVSVIDFESTIEPEPVLRDSLLERPVSELLLLPAPVI